MRTELIVQILNIVLRISTSKSMKKSNIIQHTCTIRGNSINLLFFRFQVNTSSQVKCIFGKGNFPWLKIPTQQKLNRFSLSTFVTNFKGHINKERPRKCCFLKNLSKLRCHYFVIKCNFQMPFWGELLFLLKLLYFLMARCS